MTADGEILHITASNLDPNTSRAINVLGKDSAKAQGLSYAITLVGKLQTSGDSVYLYRQQQEQYFVGFIRVGKRKLFLYDVDTKLHEMDPLCCLDFYVSESMQRRGIGRQLFEEMLRQEKISSPSQLAFDKPSSKLLSFLSKNFALDKPIAQANNFVVFLDFFPISRTDPKVPKFQKQCQSVCRAKTHYDSTGVASLFSTDIGELERNITKRPAYHAIPLQIDGTHTASLTLGKVADVLTQAQLYRKDDIEALRLSEESLSQINKKIDQRESTIVRIEKELQTLNAANEDLNAGKPRKSGFSKSELIRQIHTRK